MAARLTAARPSAVLLDLDGTLVDSEPLWSAAAGALARAHGHPWTGADDAAIVGWSVPAVSSYLRARGVPLAPERIARELHAGVAAALDDGVPWRPGALRLLAMLRRVGVPRALVTMTYRALAVTVTESLPAGMFDVVVGGDEVDRPKPDPQAYLRAARSLGVDARACVALEDSPTGVQSALASGAWTYAVDPNQALPGRLTSHPRLRRLDGLDSAMAALS